MILLVHYEGRWLHVCSDFEYFLDGFMKAGELIDKHYFKIDVTGAEEAVFRERVYCYELYHHLRNVLGDNFPYKLDGELDKINHPIIYDKIGAKKPDFVVHIPGDMARNLVVIEVKPISTRIDRFRDDLNTLQLFLSKAKYYRAIMIIYGDDESYPIDRLKKEFRSFANEKLLLVWHKKPNELPILMNI